MTGIEDVVRIEDVVGVAIVVRRMAAPTRVLLGELRDPRKLGTLVFPHGRVAPADTSIANAAARVLIAEVGINEPAEAFSRLQTIDHTVDGVAWATHVFELMTSALMVNMAPNNTCGDWNWFELSQLPPEDSLQTVCAQVLPRVMRRVLGQGRRRG